MGFASIRDLAQAREAGRTHFCSFRKVPSQATVAGWWADLSMASGNPVPNYYAATPLQAKAFDGYDGIFHGANKAPSTKHVASLGLMTATAAMVGLYTLADYLLYYPFVDGDSTDEQALDNSTAQLTRYASGAGVLMMAVAVAPSTGAGLFTVNYVNQAGVTKTSPVQTCSTTAANIATIITSQQAVAGASVPASPYLALADGDTGVRQIDSVTFTVPNGGLIALVLVKPLTDLAIREINTMAEVEMVRCRPGAPTIADGAYLNLIANPTGSIAAGVLTGYANFAWSA